MPNNGKPEKVLIPKANAKDVILENKYVGKIEIVAVETLSDVLENALVGPKKEGFIKKLATIIPKPAAANRAHTMILIILFVPPG